MNNPVNVIKRDGSTQNFDPAKIYGVMRAAGLADEQAGTVRDAIVSWLDGKASVTSLEIRDKVLESLLAIDPGVAAMYKWYEAMKDGKKE